MKSRECTMTDLARRAGVHCSTVSLALRNHPRISATRRKLVQRLAVEMGYRPNPLVSALMTSRRRRGRGAEHGTVLCYLTSGETRDEWRHFTPQFQPAAAARAKALGYRLEPFWLFEPGQRPERLVQILRSRGIFGVLVAPPPYQVTELLFPWDEFAAVILGANCRRPAANRVAYNHFESANLAFRRVTDAGCERIGLVELGWMATMSAKRRLGGYLSEQSQLPRSRQLPVMRSTSRDPDKFEAWLEKNQPDAILTIRYQEVRKALDEIGGRWAKRVLLVDLEKHHADDPWPGIYHDPQHVGSHSVNLLVSALGLNDRGLPEEPCESLISGVWSPGA